MDKFFQLHFKSSEWTVIFAITHPIKLFGNQENRWVRYLRIILGLIVLGIGAVFTEGGVVVIPFMLATYFFRNAPQKRNTTYMIYAIVLAISSLSGAFIYDDPIMTLEMILYNSDWLFISVLPFLYLYNGEHGKKTDSQNISSIFFILFTCG